MLRDECTDSETVCAKVFGHSVVMFNGQMRSRIRKEWALTRILHVYALGCIVLLLVRRSIEST